MKFLLKIKILLLVCEYIFVSFNGDWLMAMKYSEKLLTDSKWSKATYAYTKAAFLMMNDEQTDETIGHVSYLME